MSSSETSTPGSEVIPPGSEATALEAGLAPVGTPGGEPVTARRYHHPRLGARPVVLLCGDATAPGEDRVLAAAGFAAPDVGAPVAAGHRGELGYPAWAVVHDPAHAQVALDAAPKMARAELLARPKPGPALDIYQALAATLPDDHLPVYWEQVGRAFIAAERHRQAAMMFGRARAAEQHVTAVDPVRRSAVFLEFALAGALSAKDIKAYVADLSRSPDPAAAYRELRELAVRRTLGGLPPWPDMFKQLGKLAKAAGLDVAEEHGLVLAALLDAPALWRASEGFWTSQRKTWVAAMAGSAPVKRRLLWRLAELPYSDLDAWWVALLDEVAAFDELGDDTGAWLSRMLRRYGGGRRAPKAPQKLLDLLPRLADRVAPESRPLPLGNGTTHIDAAVIGGCLAAGIAVADPDPHLLLAHWSDQNRVDLVALTADDRFATPLTRSIVEDKGYSGYDERWRTEWTIEPLRPFLRDIVDSRLRWAESSGLQTALDAFEWLHGTVSRQAVTHMPDLPARLAAVDMVTPLTRTLRAGIFDEYGWDALDQAAAELGRETWCRASWPILTVHNQRKAIAVGPGGRIMEHRLKVPSNASRFSYDVRVFFSAGEFLVFHAVNQTQTLYWSGAPQQLHMEQETSWRWRYGERKRAGYTFVGPRVQRFTGAPLPSHGPRLLSVGDNRLGPDGHMFHDGRTFWWYTGEGAGSQVRPIDPVTEELGEPGLPEFLDPALLGEDEHWQIGRSSLAPVAPGTATSPLGTDGTHLGFRVARDRRTGEVGYHRIDGVHGTVPATIRGVVPWGLLDVPGSDGRLLLDSHTHYHVYSVTARDPETGEAYWRAWMTDPDRVVMDDPDPMAAGTVRMPPKAFWHFLTPRDLAGSRALRAISEDTVRGLLAAAATSESTLREAIGRLLPDVSHPLLRDGIVGIVKEAARRIPDRNRLLKVLEPAVPKQLEVSGPDLDDALYGLVSHFGEGHGGLVRQVELAAAFFSGSIDGETAMAHWDIHRSQYDWTELAGRIGGLAVRAAGAVTPAAQRTALTALLKFWASSPLLDPSLQRGLHDHESPKALSTAEGRLLPLDIAMHFGDWARSHDDSNYTIKAFLQRGDVPRPDGYIDVRPVASGWATAKRLKALVAELERRDPVPFEPAAAERLAAATDLDRAAAALLLAGLPGVEDSGRVSDLTRENLGLKVTEADAARDRWWRVPAAARLELYDAAMPDDVAELWDQHAMADRLAVAWRKLPQAAT